MKILLEVQKAYIAGIIDGEGTIGAVINRKDKHRHINYFVRIANTNLEVLQIIQGWIGAGFITHDSVRPENRHQMHRLTLSSRQAEELVKELFPYLIIKKERAEIFIKLREMRRSRITELRSRDGRTGRFSLAGGILYNDEEMALLIKLRGGRR